MTPLRTKKNEPSNLADHIARVLDFYAIAYRPYPHLNDLGLPSDENREAYLFSKMADFILGDDDNPGLAGNFWGTNLNTINDGNHKFGTVDAFDVDIYTDDTQIGKFLATGGLDFYELDSEEYAFSHLRADYNADIYMLGAGIVDEGGEWMYSTGFYSVPNLTTAGYILDNESFEASRVRTQWDQDLLTLTHQVNQAYLILNQDASLDHYWATAGLNDYISYRVQAQNDDSDIINYGGFDWQITDTTPANESSQYILRTIYQGDEVRIFFPPYPGTVDQVLGIFDVTGNDVTLDWLSVGGDSWPLSGSGVLGSDTDIELFGHNLNIHEGSNEILKAIRESGAEKTTLQSWASGNRYFKLDLYGQDASFSLNGFNGSGGSFDISGDADTGKGKVGGVGFGINLYPTASPFAVAALPAYANNAAAVGGGLAVGDFYRNGDIVQVVH